MEEDILNYLQTAMFRETHCMLLINPFSLDQSTFYMVPLRIGQTPLYK